MVQETIDVVVVVIDRLGASYLGPYGNTWLETPAWNRLANEATLFETAITDAIELRQTYRSYMSGVPAYRQAAAAQSLADELQTAGVTTVLLTDSREVAEFHTAKDFSEVILLPTEDLSSPCVTLEETQFARLLGAAVERLADLPSPFFLWIHAQAMHGPWDAPLALREQFAEEDDPLPSACISAPNVALDRRRDPDQVLSLVHAYAGNVVAVDRCLEPFLEAVRRPDDRRALVVTSSRGFALGEHGHVGACGDTLYAEVLQVPLLVRWPGGEHAARRLHRPVEPVDLWVTLRNLVCGASDVGRQANPPRYGQDLRVLADQWLAAATSRDYVCSKHADTWSIRTPVWFYREASGSDSDRQLFAKPDDRFEVNEVADRCSEIVSEFHETLSKLRELEDEGGLEILPSLPSILLTEGE